MKGTLSCFHDYHDELRDRATGWYGVAWALLVVALLGDHGGCIVRADRVKLPKQAYKLPWWHPPIQNIFKNRIPGPDNHPPVNDLLRAYIWAHTNERHDRFDGRNGWIRKPKFEGGHPNLDIYFQAVEPPADLVAVTVSSFHPDSDKLYKAETPIPENHPSLHNQFSNLLPKNHPNVDKLLADPRGNPLPWWHPPLSSFISQAPPLDLPTISTFSYHPNADEYYAAGTPISDRHPLVQDMLADVLAKMPNHPNVDKLLQDPVKNPLPLWHPKLEELIKRRKEEELPQISTFSFHPDVDASYAAGTPMSDEHPSVQFMMLAYLPVSHRDCDIMLRNPLEYPLPSWHPPLLQHAHK
eukprot:scaffold59034_cov42-Attheya_sp.AAC.3